MAHGEDLANPQQSPSVTGVGPLGTGFALLRLLTDYQRLLKAERARVRGRTPSP
ncbi:hypothetical protein [Streptomyces sp. BRA346]|uniref:hypothetical protein n=1 Tax=Streptomyces sp. BRA346 TaxID=2878199 RepID=UPI004062F032